MKYIFYIFNFPIVWNFVSCALTPEIWLRALESLHLAFFSFFLFLFCLYSSSSFIYLMLSGHGTIEISDFFFLFSCLGHLSYLLPLQALLLFFLFIWFFSASNVSSFLLCLLLLSSSVFRFYNSMHVVSSDFLFYYSSRSLHPPLVSVWPAICRSIRLSRIGRICQTVCPISVCGRLCVSRQRKTISNTFGHRNNVRNDILGLKSQIMAASSPKSRLQFICHLYAINISNHLVYSLEISWCMFHSSSWIVLEMKAPYVHV